MKFFVVFILLISTISISTADDECPSDKTPSNPHQKLKEFLLCDYDKTIRPVINHQNATIVRVRMNLKSFTFSSSGTYLAVNSWLAMNWQDDHLKWDPLNFNGIVTTHFSSEDIWTPDLSLFNRDNQGDDPAAFSKTDCLIRSTGSITCVPATRNDGLCVPDLTKFPYDTQTCILKFGSWVHKGEEISFELPDPAIVLDDYTSNSGWKLINVTVTRDPGIYECCPNSTYPTLDYKFVIERLATSHLSTIIIPSVVMVILTLLTLWLQPISTERLCLASVNLIFHFLYLQNVSSEVPPNGEKVPLILTFLKDSMILCTLVILITIIIREILTRKDDSPRWVTNATMFILTSNIRPFLLLSPLEEKNSTSSAAEEDDSNNLVNIQAGRHKDWIVFAKIVDRICFVLFTLTYLILLLIVVCS